MTTTFQERLHNLHVDEDLLALIASKVSRVDRPPVHGSEGIGFQLLRFLEAKPDCALEAARAIHLPREVREVIARKLAQEFVGGSATLPPRTHPPVEEGAPAVPDIVEVPDPQARSPYRAVFGCRYQRPSSSATNKPTSKGGD